MAKRILIVDDTPFFRHILREIALKGGFEVIGEATNGAEAVRMAKELLPDIIILDVVMPVQDGLRAAGELRRCGLPVRIVMCSSIGPARLADSSAEIGANAYINKPLNETEVLKILNSL